MIVVLAQCRRLPTPPGNIEPRHSGMSPLAGKSERQNFVLAPRQ